MKNENLILRLESNENDLIYMLDNLYKEEITSMLEDMGAIVIDLENEDIALPYSPQVLDITGNKYVYYSSIELDDIYPYVILENGYRMPLHSVGHRELGRIYGNVKHLYFWKKVRIVNQ